MQLSKSPPNHKSAAGFTLPAILVVVGALLILAVGILLVVGIERNTAHSFADRERANLAARAGLEEVKGILVKEAANDDFLILQGTDPVTNSKKDPIPYLYLARGSGAGTTLKYKYLPLFSTATMPPAPSTGGNLEAPKPKNLIGSNPYELTTLPWCDPGKVAWVQIPDSNGKIVSRYAYWVEDLQSRVDATTAGNTKDAGAHKRYGWKTGDISKFARFPAPGLNAEDSKPGSNGRDAEPPLDQVALYTVDPAAGAKDNSDLDKTIIDNRKALVSPDSVLAVAGIVPPLTRENGHLVDPKARAVEENLTASVQPYDEQALVPFAKGIDASVVGKPKLNLNSLLAKPPADAVDEMAAWINKGLPTFESRKGGFPDNYLKTLAANAIDYADTDKEATVSQQQMTKESYRGLDAYPLMSEVILHIKYLGVSNVKGRKIMKWEMILFVELWNHTSQKIAGNASVTYENKLRPPAIGTGVTGGSFDSDELLGDSLQVAATPALSKSGGYYWSGPLAQPDLSEVRLEPNQYQFYRAVTINYTIDVGPSSIFIDGGYSFEIAELKLGSSGISLKWNDRIVDRSDKLLRGSTDPANAEFDFTVGTKKQVGQAQIPAHSYGIPSVGLYKDVMGDSRQSLYLLGPDGFPLSNNAYPRNVSPNRRNIRNSTIYKNGAGSASVFGRVLPSDWPDGGHDTVVPSSALPILTKSQSDAAAIDYDPANLTIYPAVTNALEGEAPTFISNRGRFYSATELGRIFDPIMYEPKYDNADDTKSILKGIIPTGRVSWPSVEAGSTASPYYGGGNTLRIGRPEHPLFDQPAKHGPAEMPGNHAARLLDLFQAGKSRSESKSYREGSLVRIEGHINVNTASKDAIRAVVGGLLVTDPRLSKRISESHSASTMTAPISPLEVSVPTKTKEGDELADAIVRGRPYASPSEIASALNGGGKVAFGDRDLLPDGNKVQWSDAAAEEAFDRVYESSTTRSRNFRVWVIGQAIAPTVATNSSPTVLSEVRKSFTIFADPSTRKTDGSLDVAKFKTTILNENDF